MRVFVPDLPKRKKAAPAASVRRESRPASLAAPQGSAGRDFRFGMAGAPLAAPAAASGLASRLSETCGAEAPAARVLPASPVADERHANAVTVAGAVHLSSFFPRLEPVEQERILAHEAVHVAQNLAPGPPASASALEREARRLAPQLVSGHRVQPRLHADAATALTDEDGGPMPNDVIAVRNAKARREVLLRWKAVYEGSKDKNLIAEHQKILDQRIALDDSMQDHPKKARLLGPAPEVEDYRKKERENLAKLNKKPVTLEVTETDIRLRVRSNVRFEGADDKKAKAMFPALRQNLEKGIQDTWDQRLKGILLPGRTIRVIPDVSLVPADAPRNYDFWLISVRPTDKGPMVYGTEKLGDAPKGKPTSATSAQLDGDVMSIPPSHINLPDILGHESLHLFGLADRYVILPDDPDEPGPDTFGLRDTQGRLDPLGADKKGNARGKILEEDLGFVLD